MARHTRVHRVLRAGLTASFLCTPPPPGDSSSLTFRDIKGPNPCLVAIQLSLVLPSQQQQQLDGQCGMMSAQQEPQAQSQHTSKQQQQRSLTKQPAHAQDRAGGARPPTSESKHTSPSCQSPTAPLAHPRSVDATLQPLPACEASATTTGAPGE